MSPSTDRHTDAGRSEDAGNPSQWLNSFLRLCEQLIDAHNATLEQLRASIVAAEAERQQVRDAQTGARQTLDNLHAAQEQAATLQATAAQWEVVARLRVVPPQQTEQATAPSCTMSDTATRGASGDADHSQRPIEIKGERSRILLTVMATKPDHEWSVGEVATELNEPAEDGNTKKLRTGLDYLCGKEILEKIHSPRKRRIGTPGESHVRYRIINPWRMT